MEEGEVVGGAVDISKGEGCREGEIGAGKEVIRGRWRYSWGRAYVRGEGGLEEEISRGRGSWGGEEGHRGRDS